MSKYIRTHALSRSSRVSASRCGQWKGELRVTGAARDTQTSIPPAKPPADRLNGFHQQFIADITTAQAGVWLRKASGNRTTKNNLRGMLVTVFKWSWDCGYLAQDNKTAPESSGVSLPATHPRRFTTGTHLVTPSIAGSLAIFSPAIVMRPCASALPSPLAAPKAHLNGAPGVS